MDLEWGPTDEQETIKAFNCQTKVGPRHLVEDRCGASHARMGSCKFVVRWNNENGNKHRALNQAGLPKACCSMTFSLSGMGSFHVNVVKVFPSASATGTWVPGRGSFQVRWR